MDLIQLDWTTQLSHTLECYNVTVEEEYEDPRKVNIPETEGHHEVEGPQIKNPDITVPLKIEIGKYWNGGRAKNREDWRLLG